MLALLFLIFILYLITGSIEAAMALFVGGALIYAGINILNDSSRRANIRGLNCFDLQSVNEFNSFRESCNRFAGVYVLINKTSGLHYVGQSVDVFSRVNSHFSGRGNGDVYADYKYGCPFEVILIPLQRPYESLNELEREMIRYYGADKEYNKTKGNRG